MSKSFAIAASEAAGYTEDLEPFTMEGDETQLYAYLPTEGQLVLLLGLLNVDENDEEDATRAGAEMLGIFWELLDEESERHLRRRLRRREDHFSILDIRNILRWLIEEAAARPTERSSASTDTPSGTGNRSTARARQRASTRSPSTRAGSATSSTRSASSR